MNAAALERIGYFGKLPACSDFIKLAPDAGLMGVLDDWLAQVMTRLPDDPRWKLHYDVMAPVSFAFVGPRRRHAVAGRIVASHDQSGRRFPFLIMRTVGVTAPADFVAHCPLALAPLLAALERAMPALLASNDPARPLQDIADHAPAPHQDAAGALAAFMGQTSIATLAALLAAPTSANWCWRWACCCSRSCTAAPPTWKKAWCSRCRPKRPRGRRWRPSGWN